MTTERVIEEEKIESNRLITYFVDDEKQETKMPTLTVAEVLEKAGLDPRTHYLIELRGEHQVKHGDPNEKLQIHEKEKFISVFNGPTPLS